MSLISISILLGAWLLLDIAFMVKRRRKPVRTSFYMGHIKTEDASIETVQINSDHTIEITVKAKFDVPKTGGIARVDGQKYALIMEPIKPGGDNNG